MHRTPKPYILLLTSAESAIQQLIISFPKKMSLSKEHLRILKSMSNQHFLKSHRDIEGNKSYQLHPLRGEPEQVNPKIVEDLRNQRYIDSNKKFPVATFWLTEKGKTLLDQT